MKALCKRARRPRDWDDWGYYDNKREIMIASPTTAFLLVRIFLGKPQLPTVFFAIGFVYSSDPE